MAKRSNKTEHVMKLITKEKSETAETVDSPDIETTVSSAAINELNVKTKLKIEIEPEIEIKEAGDGSTQGIRRHVSGIRRNPSNDGNPGDGSEQYDSGQYGGSDTEADYGSGQYGGSGYNPGGDSGRSSGGSDRGQTIQELVSELSPEGVYDFSDYESNSDRGRNYEAGGYSRGKMDEIPDGTPYENMGDTLRPDIFVERAKANRKPETLEEVRASIKKDEEKRMKKIEFEGQLFGFNNNIINLTELLTKELMPSIMEKMGVCNCSLCASNVMALALNTLPPKYVTTDAGKQYSQLELFKSQSELDVVQAVTKACLRVKTMPRHEEGDAVKP